MTLSPFQLPIHSNETFSLFYSDGSISDGLKVGPVYFYFTWGFRVCFHSQHMPIMKILQNNEFMKFYVTKTELLQGSMAGSNSTLE